MHELPHRYVVSATAKPAGTVSLDSETLPPMVSDSPAEFGGPGGNWSPEHLLVAAVGDCLVLTFRAIARASRLEWTSLDVNAEGMLDRLDGALQFTEFTVRATLALPAATDGDKARRLLEKAEALCLVTRSLKAPCHLEATITEGV